ncbi:GNAT family protein [uncultured Lacinutrix sp.]|uniref:GNAT family N-acetyltransferase n=1 Tax=uncultured Lacinutrix sp. TaxID=574032 RepID=UPI00261B41F4|nr:GNAT family protein [uncultured Lacinutrix sp.]
MIKLRNLNLNDLEIYKYWKLPFHKYHSLNGPYFKKDSKETIEKQIEVLKSDFTSGKNTLENKNIISNKQNDIIGEVSWYWKSQETNWMEIGIVIFDEKFWNKGIGYLALKLWIEKIFNEKKDIIRLGITTWSGNYGMIKLAKKLGMKKEAEYRKARIIDGTYYDSISYGILKEEWYNN